MSRVVTVAATQMACDNDRLSNIERAEALVRQAHSQGAQIILLQELFETPYFCKKHKAEYLSLATTVDENPAIAHFSRLAAELEVVLPICFYELSGQARFNSVVMIDADGRVLPNLYRKSHIPDGWAYSEKFYFSPGDTGFQVWDTRYARIGLGICWDQWFPETARCLALQGAELIFYPTAIGSEPQDAGLDSRRHWQRTQQGHAAANLTPVIASNRVGTEWEDEVSITFYGSSFIANQHGELVAEADQQSETVLVHSFDLDELARMRRGWGVFRDRRPELYGALATFDGRSSAFVGKQVK
ncbi:N-carbamoylputrescine amidase [Marinobacterium lacunae]|uniref:N-carbamoylputrescine amidase n=1 Tax=Marinobacterium lacunae TaxID=1232683 RepID=A0A081FX97_9GAMM|nr:N-carbamoylputrescine amidase [Marinobacterium lacunae]KEA63152.1 N-carbamoylputrescine amidase [Marinobacterium lacunae]MBR9884583.1 N-carbamoylputrescine amidase [Oceanospirillales bacterium]